MNHKSKVGHLATQQLYLEQRIVPDLARAARVVEAHPPQGRYPSASYNVRGTSDGSPTERHALQPDPEQQLVNHVMETWTSMLKAAHACLRAIAALDALDKPAQPKPLRESTLPPPCECCGETTLRIEGGLCAEKCAPSWRRHRATTPHPDRTRWLTARRKRLTDTTNPDT